MTAKSREVLVVSFLLLTDGFLEAFLEERDFGDEIGDGVTKRVSRGVVGSRLEKS